MKKIGIGIIGCGLISGWHAPGYLSSLAKCEIVAVADVVEEAAKKRAGEWGAKDWFKDYKDLLKHPKVDAVDVCLPHNLHAPVAVAAAEAGKHVIVDKPMARSVKEADEMIRAARRDNVKLMVSHNERFLLQHQKAKELMDQGAVGDIGLATAAIYGNLGMDVMTGWRASIEKTGGGILIDSGAHRLDLLHWLVGDVREVFCATERVQFKMLEGEDTAFIVMRFKNGALGQLNVTWGARGMLWGSDWNETLLISGDKGTIATDNLTSSIRYQTTGMTTFASIPYWFSYEQSVAQSAKHFVDSIVEDKTPLISGEDGRAVIQIVEAAYRSAKENKPVSL